jgi:hypothetical protein
MSFAAVVPDFNQSTALASLWQTVVYARIRIYSVEAVDGGEWSTPTDPWTVAGDCRAEDQYMNNTVENPLNFRCEDCDSCQVCDETSTGRIPVVQKGCWRHNPTHPDLIKYPFYRCPGVGTCTGGRGIQGRCAAGYHDSPGFNQSTKEYPEGGGPMCTTCTANYVKRGETCVYCANATVVQKHASVEMVGLFIGLVFLGFLILFAWYLYYFRKEIQHQTYSKNSEKARGRRKSAIAPAHQFDSGKKYAVYIAVDRYKFQKRLKGCKNDAVAAEEKLSGQHKYETIGNLYNEEVTFAKVDDLFKKIAGKVQPEDQLIIYMAGKWLICWNNL